MICFTLRCGQDHRFDSWFTSSAAYDGLARAGHLACPICGDTAVEKALMAPAIAVSEGEKPQHSLAKPQSEVEAAMAQMRQMVEENSDYVGLNFASEVRKMHVGEVPTRAVYGEAKLDEARALLEEGIPVAPLPFVPRAKLN